MPQSGISLAGTLAYFSCSAFLRPRAREIRAAKTIFHLSGWSARYRPASIACRRWFHRGRARDFLSLGSVQSLFRQMASWFALDHEWPGPGGRIFHAVCGTFNGVMLPWDRPFLVSGALMGLA